MNLVLSKGKEMIAITTFAWMQKQEMVESLTSKAACWCGETPGTCSDCQDCDVSLAMTKTHIGSGEDCDVFR